jgi:menaquinone-9 beta-reductase
MLHVVIIGAGPAGAAAASFLARSPHPIQVTLIEQRTFPRDKTCGDCLSAMGIDVIDRLGALEALRRQGGVALTHSTFHTADSTSVEFALPRPMLGIVRRSLDQLLLDHARQSGATVVQPARVENISDNVVTVRELRTNQTSTIPCDYVLLADGKGSATVVDKFGMSAHFWNVQNIPANGIGLYFGKTGAYCGLAPIGGGKWNIAASVPLTLLREHRGDAGAVFRRLLDENPNLREGMGRAFQTSPWRLIPLARFAVRKTWPPGTIPIGNAAASIEPVGGEGIGLALHSAELASNAIVDALKSDCAVDISGLRNQFEKLWQTRSWASSAIAGGLCSTHFAPLLLNIAHQVPPISRTAMHLLGK